MYKSDWDGNYVTVNDLVYIDRDQGCEFWGFKTVAAVPTGYSL